MRKVYTIGETVYDIIFKNNQPVAAKAGGSMLNCAISMGRMKLPVSFISEYGQDEIGTSIDQFLIDNHVNTEFVYKFTEGKTSIAIAFLNERNDAHYSFYKQLPVNRLNVSFPTLEKDDLILFGSFYSIAREVRPKLKVFIKAASLSDSIIIYDPNFRKAHLFELNDLMPFIIENIQMSTIVRGSNEDFKMIFDVNTVDQAYEKISKYCEYLIYTSNSEGVTVRTPKIKAHFKSKTISPLSTIGAGDSFNAGIVCALNKFNISKKQLSELDESQWEKIIQIGIDLASEVCMSYDNYISADFANNYGNASPDVSR